MDFTSICRTCLSDGSLTPLFNDVEDHDTFSRTIYMATGIKIHYNDDLPQNMCTNCIMKLNDVLKFRKQCKNSETTLLTQIKKSKTGFNFHSGLENDNSIEREYEKRVKTENTDSKKTTNSEDNKGLQLLIPINSCNIKLINSEYIKNKQSAISYEIKYTTSDDEITEEKPIIISPELTSLDNTLGTCNDNEITEENSIITKSELILTDDSREICNKTKQLLIPINSCNTELINSENLKNEQPEISYETTYTTSDEEIMEEKPIIVSLELPDNTLGNCKDNEITEENSIITKPKLILTDDSPENCNKANNYTNNLDSKESTPSLLDSNDVTDIPYEIIINSVTQKPQRVLCKLCNKELSIRSIDFHMTHRHAGSDVRRVKCDLCDTYIMKNRLNRHMMLRHGRHMLLVHGGGSFRCGYCKQEFDNKELLLEHGVSCSAKKRKRKVNQSVRELSECDECHKVMQKASIRMHKAVKHAGLKPVCEHCGKSFGNKFRLNEHYRAKHDYEKFKCSYCDFQSAGALAMRNHERRHRDEKPFVCEQCGAKFHAAYLLTQHRHSHRTEKLIKCDLCPSTFKANNSLHMHKLTCHSHLAYQCNICSRSYKCRHYAVKHIRHVHRYTGPDPPLTVVTNNDVVKP